MKALQDEMAKQKELDTQKQKEERLEASKKLPKISGKPTLDDR